MGMFTQVRGWLNINSISADKADKVKETYYKAVEEYSSKERTPRQEFVMQDTRLYIGSNNSTYIFIGTELKNYDTDAEKWLEFLISKFYNADGHIMFQYEEDETLNKIWIVSNGKINEKFEDFDFKGYGNMFEPELQLSDTAILDYLLHHNGLTRMDVMLEIDKRSKEQE